MRRSCIESLPSAVMFSLQPGVANAGMAMT